MAILQLNTVFSSFPMMETSRLVLRRISLEDVESVYNLFKQKELLEYNTWKTISTRDEAWKLVMKFDREYETESSIRWGLMHRQALELMGDIALGHFIDQNKSARISYDVHPDYWQQGYATEALQNVLQFAISTLKLHRIEALVHPLNTSSLVLLDKFNFKKEGILRDYFYKEEQYHEAYLLSLLSQDFDPPIQ